MRKMESSLSWRDNNVIKRGLVWSERESLGVKTTTYSLFLLFTLLVVALFLASCDDHRSAESGASRASGLELSAGAGHQQYAWVKTETIGTNLSLRDVRATADWPLADERWRTLAAKVGDDFGLEATYYHGAKYLGEGFPRVMLDSHPGYAKITVGWRSPVEQRMIKEGQLQPQGSWRTNRGLEQGDSFDRMLGLYGTPTAVSSRDAVNARSQPSWADYEYTTESGEKYRVTFSLRDGKVEYVEKWWESPNLDWSNLGQKELAPEEFFPKT